MTNAPIKVGLFKSEVLNDLALRLIRLDDEYATSIEKAENSLYNAFKTRWLFGKYIHEYYDFIIAECGSQKAFAERMRKSEGVISNNKRGYEALLKEGVTTWEEVVNLLKENNIKPHSRNFEKIGNLLNEPKKDTKQLDQKEKDQKRLEQLRAEAEEIYQRNEAGTSPHIAKEAIEYIDDIDDIKQYVESFDPEKVKWKSEYYLDFVRNFGYDLVTGEPCERCDPHHTDKNGGSGGEGMKLPDYYCIPVSRTTHQALESGMLVLTPEEILEMQFKVMSTFITKHLTK